MIVGTKAIDLTQLKEICFAEYKLEKYCESLIPAYARDIPHILDNQKYIVAQEIRELHSISYGKRNMICEKLLDGVSIKGYLQSVIEIEDVILSCDMDKLLGKIFEKELKSVR